ncbi:unnamed protein product [Prorocentrum cordatum]|uniref:Beta-galactosidase n=1 Tax=Prorocentrum cordatum TaxID=2364126 RepID=A0ABN9RKS9_9DINO|nr:unnamed protein product [Polarella glacialis]
MFLSTSLGENALKTFCFAYRPPRADWVGNVRRYTRELNVTGAWAELKKARGYQYNVAHDEVETPAWIAFGKVELKVTRGHTNSGMLYLNVYVRHLGRAGFAIGGLLGEDDHSDVSEPAAACTKHLSLEKSARQHMSASFSASTAEGSFA